MKFGEGNIICPNSVLTTDISIGDANIFNIQTTVGHDVVIGSFNTFSSNVDVTGYSLIGNANFLVQEYLFFRSVVLGPITKLLPVVLFTRV